MCEYLIKHNLLFCNCCSIIMINESRLVSIEITHNNDNCILVRWRVWFLCVDKEEWHVPICVSYILQRTNGSALTTAVASMIITEDTSVTYVDEGTGLSPVVLLMIVSDRITNILVYSSSLAHGTCCIIIMERNNVPVHTSIKIYRYTK